MGSSYAVAGFQAAGLDGIYTKDQAARGAAVFGQSCAKCHNGDLTGWEEQKVPALTGAAFSTKGNDHPLAELYEKMRLEMPKDEPGILNRTQYADILSFILSRNGVSAGTKELPDGDELKAIKFVAVKPPVG